jgi:hypothetical protein
MFRGLPAGDNTYQKDFVIVFNIRNQQGICINFHHQHALIWILVFIWMNQIVKQPFGPECEQHIFKALVRTTAIIIIFSIRVPASSISMSNSRICPYMIASSKMKHLRKTVAQDNP